MESREIRRAFLDERRCGFAELGQGRVVPAAEEAVEEHEHGQGRQDADEEDGDGWIKVPSKRHVPKNVSSKDPRDVPKRWRK